jgi:hypothetical protein
LGPIALGGSIGYGANQYSGPTEVSGGAFVGGIGIAYAIGLTPSFNATYRSSPPQAGSSVSCDPALMVVTPLVNVTAVFPKNPSGDRGLDVSISVGLTFGVGVVGGVYCGASIDTPPLVSNFNRRMNELLP